MSIDDKQLRSRRRVSNRALWIIGIGLLVIALAVFIFLGYYFEWRWTGFARKRLFEWIQILVIPVAVAIGTFVLNRAAKRRDDETQREQREREQANEIERAEEASLQAYLDYISGLLTDPDRPLRRTHVGDNLSVVARAQTLTVLGRLEDGKRKRSVLQFLHKAGLIDRTYPILNLRGADIKDALLEGAYLQEADLIGADLRRTDLRRAYFIVADLRGAHLEGAFLDGADLRGADLEGARNLEQDQIEQAIGDDITTLPERIDRPKSWSAYTDE